MSSTIPIQPLPKLLGNNTGDKNAAITRSDPGSRRSFTDKLAYAKLQSVNLAGNRHSVDNIKERFEICISRQNLNQINNIEFTSSLIKPKPTILPKPKHENNMVHELKPAEEHIVIRPSVSQNSIDQIAEELSLFTMDTKPKDRKRSNSFRKFLSGSFFGKDKKKKEEDKNRFKTGKNRENKAYNDNIKNETNFNRQSSIRSTVPIQNKTQPQTLRNSNGHDETSQEIHEKSVQMIHQQYAHINNNNQIRNSFIKPKRNDNLSMDHPPKKSISDFLRSPVNRYIDTSSSVSADSENGVLMRNTPPRAQETYQNLRRVKPKAFIPLQSERFIENLYQNELSPRTTERNLNRGNEKEFSDKPYLEETYGTVLDSLEYTKMIKKQDKSTIDNYMFNLKPINPPKDSPKSPTLEISKLKLPPNREVFEVQPRMKSPTSSNNDDTNKMIATELLKKSRSPTLLRREFNYNNNSEVNINKPPLSLRVLQPKLNNFPAIQQDKVVTNAMVHAPNRSVTPLQSYDRSSFQRPTTPVDLRMSAALKLSPQKEDIRKSVQEYYWKELKKMKEEEDLKYTVQMVNGYCKEPVQMRRSRSVSPASQQIGRSLSLPRQLQFVENSYGKPQSIPEERTLIVDGMAKRHLVYDQAFVRNNPERRSADHLQRPIFRRGSLNKQEIYENQQYNKRVSFSNSQVHQQVWPTKNGYMQSPPQRRLDQRESVLEDDVFLPNSTLSEPIYGQRYYYQKSQQGEPLYNEYYPQKQFEYEALRQPIEAIQAHEMQRMGSRRLSMDSLASRSKQNIYFREPYLVHHQRDVVVGNEIYGQSNNFQQLPSNSQILLHRTPDHFSYQSVADSVYGLNKHVTVRNKVCDFYGQIHDSPQNGVIMGQLQDSPKMTKHQPPGGLVCGGRMLASATDIGHCYQKKDPRHQTHDPRFQNNYPRYQNKDHRYHNISDNLQKPLINYDNRPLPPVPTKKSFGAYQISDTESGSDVSEIQRIMQNKNKSKTSGSLGK